MASPAEPFADVNKLLMSFDQTWMVNEFTKILAQLNVPTVNLDALVASQKQNLEALTTANNAAVEAVSFPRPPATWHRPARPRRLLPNRRSWLSMPLQRP